VHAFPATLYWFVGHGVHDKAFTALYFPASQVVHALDPATEKVFAEQSEQALPTELI
jgi:hypothetical protein